MIIIQIHNNTKTAHPAHRATQELIKRATVTTHIIFFFMSLPESAKRYSPLQSPFPPPPRPACLLCLPHIVAPHPRNAAQLSEIVCENTTQYSRIMMTLLTSVRHKKNRRPERAGEKKREKETPHNHKDIFRRIKRPKRPALDTATPSDRAR